MEVTTLGRGHPEVALLLGCARSRMDPVAAEAVRNALQQKIDWERVLAEAFKHGTAPLLYWNLTRAGFTGIPESALSRLKGAFNINARWSLSLTGELLKLLKLFREIGIRALPYKGPVLSAAAYGNLSLRTFGDLDILMATEDIRKAKDVLVSLGYQADRDLTASEEVSYLRSHHDYKFVRSKDGIVVELQWGVTQWSFAFPISFEDLWQRREEVAVGGTPVLNVPVEELLLILCVHGAKHQWEQLKWISDIAELVAANYDRLNWHRMLDQARSQGGERMLLLGLFLAHDLVYARLPEELLQRIQNDSRMNALARRVSERLFDSELAPLRLRDEKPVFYWDVSERPRDKWRLIWKYFPVYLKRMFVPGERDYEFMRLPKFLASGYYVVRQVRLVGMFFSMLLRAANRRDK
ncbi:MAG: nucleotidyltransferase family protein [Betaproteobacteria bacterium]